MSVTTAAARTTRRRTTALTGQNELNGTSILDVTDPKQPKYLAHIPGAVGDGEAGASQMTRVCDGKTLGKGDPNRVYLLRTFGREGHEIWEVTDPTKPKVLWRHLGMTDTHKNYWECEAGGIAYIVSRPKGWRARIVEVFDLSDPAKPVKIRDFGLPGQRARRHRRRPGHRPWHGVDRRQGQPHLHGLRHQPRRPPADPRPREAAEGAEGADAG